MPEERLVILLIAERCDHDGLDGVHTVLGFVKYDALLAAEDVIIDLADVVALFFAVLSGQRLKIVVSGQAVHKQALGIFRRGHDLACYLVGGRAA